MSLPWRVALLLLFMRQPGPAVEAPRALLREALRAVELDRVPEVRARWSRAVELDPADRGALLALGALARLTYDYPQAEARLARVIALRADDAIADQARLEQARALLVRGRSRAASDRYAAALAGAEARRDSGAMAEALLGLAASRARLAPPAEVLTFLARVERMARADPQLGAELRCQRAALRVRSGEAGARELAEEGAALARRAGDARQEGRCLQVVAQLFAAQGDIDAAARALALVTPLFERSRDHAGLASVRQWHGYLFNSLGRYGEARTELSAAIAEGERSGAASPVGWALINLGMISLGLGDRVLATQQLDRAVALLDAQGDALGVVTARSMLGGVARAAGDVARARGIYERVLEWAVGAGQALTQYNMHEALATLGELERDWPAVDRHLAAARAIARTSGMAGWEAGMRFNDGRVALRRGDLATAERSLRAFLASADASQHGARYAARALLAETEVRRGATAQGETQLLAAMDEFDGWRASLAESDLRMRAMEADLGIDPDLGVATVLAALARAGRGEAAFRLAERRRARVLNDGISRAVLAATATASAPAAPRRADVPAVTVAATQEMLGGDSTALLEFVTGRDGEPTTVFIVTRTGLATRELASIDSVDSDLRRFVTVLEGGGDARVLGERLGAALLQPAVDALGPAVVRLLIVPDDVLARLPFDALVLSDGRYAVERFAIGLAPSVGTVLAMRGKLAQRRAVRMLALGDPLFAPDSGPTGDAGDGPDLGPSTAEYRAAFAASGGLPRLAASAGEVRRVARYAPSAEVRVGVAASEAYLRHTPLGSFSIIHFATHALVDDAAVTRSALALAPDAGPDAEPDAEHDGFLGPGDLANLALEADLVVLSSCRTAGGVVVRGEGIQGFTAPLLQAGARSVIATEWRIADAATLRTIEGLYRSLADGESVVDALRSSKLAALRAGAPVREWAAFVATGDPMVRIALVRPVPGASVLTDGGPLALLAVLLVATMALLLTLVYRRRRRKRSDAAGT